MEARTTIDAPAFRGDEFPAVIRPPALKEGWSLAICSIVVSFLMLWSISITLSSPETSTFMLISSGPNHPSSTDLDALICESTENWSISSRFTPSSSASFSAVSPMA